MLVAVVVNGMVWIVVVESRRWVVIVVVVGGWTGVCLGIFGGVVVGEWLGSGRCGVSGCGSVRGGEDGSEMVNGRTRGAVV